MSKGRLKQILKQNGVNVVPIYKLTPDGKRVHPNDSAEGVMHYRAEPKKKPLF